MNAVEDDLAKALALIDENRFAEAITLLLPHAGAGVTEAESQLGVLLMLGLGAERDLAQARELLARAADKGDGCAAHNLGTLFLDRSNPAWSFDESRKWYARAKSLGFIVAHPWP